MHPSLTNSLLPGKLRQQLYTILKQNFSGRLIMKNVMVILIVLLTVTFFIAGCAAPQQPAKQYKWKVHDPDRPVPPIITPGTATSAPSDAIVLFDGSDLSEWASSGDKPAKWKVENDYMVIPKGGGTLRTRRSFGNCQLHIEWASPAEVKGSDQGRGNSGIYFMGQYEVQVLDSYNNKTYADGQAGGIYGQKPPLANACRPPGEWQTYDIIFHRPIFADEKLVKPATITVLHNNILIQDHWIIEGRTLWRQRAIYKPHADALPITLQDHGNPVRYRNIWIRPLKPDEETE